MENGLNLIIDRRNSCQHIFLVFIGVLTLSWSCTTNKKEPHPIEKVRLSMSDTLPVLTLPEEADPEHENWKGIDLEPKSPVLPLYPEEEAKRFLMPEGYQIEPILTEPQIEQPGAIAFDGNGRLYVLELRTYMLTADSDGTLDPVSRISRWEDKDNDGVYESGTAFVDHLIFPRFVLPYGKDAVLTMESDADNVYKFTDTDGDGKADKKELFTTNYGRSGNVEHQQAFMYWGMDNWLYSTVNAFRVRETPNGVIREKTGYNMAQWGVTHDDDGKLWFQGGASGVPSYFQFPIHYGNFEVENQYGEGFEIPWGAPVKIADLQEGMDRVRQPDGGPNRVTGAAGNDVFRGDRLPKALYGQYFYGEPVARIVRQVNPVVSEGLTTLHNAYENEKSEFLRSTDPLFRPVDMATAPDGTMYIVDMYHGIIQEGQWAQKGTYLRTKIEQYQLDKVTQLGRIWRITHKDHKRDTSQPKMLDESPSQLVEHLNHPNGWWRDKAQQLIVQSGDKSVIPKLREMALSDENLLARFHALWSLEGLRALDAQLIVELLQDGNSRMRVQALRLSEFFGKTRNKEFEDIYAKMMKDSDANVAIQAMLTARFMEVPALNSYVKAAMNSTQAKGVKLIGEQILHPKTEKSWWNRADTELSAEEKIVMEKGAVIFNELCVQCHGKDGMGTPIGDGLVMAPPLAGSARVQAHPDYVIKTVMHGMEGPLDNKTFPGGIMVGNEEQSDEWIAAITSYIRQNLSNDASMITKEKVAKIRQETATKEGAYRYEELMNAVPELLEPAGTWKVTASHAVPTRIGGTAAPLSAFNFEGWSSGERQKDGMWFQIEFPETMRLAEISFRSPPKRFGWGPDAPTPLQTYPRNYEFRISTDGTTWETLKSGSCEQAEVLISLDGAKARFLKMVHKGGLKEEGDIPWNMRQLKIFGNPEIDTNVN